MKIPRIITEWVVREIADRAYGSNQYGDITSELLAVIAILLVEIRDKD